MVKKLTPGLAGLLAALLAVTVVLQPGQARAAEPTPAPESPSASAPPAVAPAVSDPSPEPSDEPAVTPAGAPASSPASDPSPAPDPSVEPTTSAPASPSAATPSSPAASPSASAAPRSGGSIRPHDAVDDSNGILTVRVDQSGATNGSLTQIVGSTFEYSVTMSCFQDTGKCLTGGKITIDLSAWKGYTFGWDSLDPANLTNRSWDPATGQLVLTLADIGLESKSFSYGFSITTPSGVTSSGRDLTFDAVLSGTDTASVTSNQVDSHITGAIPTVSITKTSSRVNTYLGEDVVWTISESHSPATGVLLPKSRIVRDTIPAELTYVGCTYTSYYDGCVWNPTDRTVTWTATSWRALTDSYPVGTVTTTVPMNATVGVQIPNVASVATVHADDSTESHPAVAYTTPVVAPTLPTAVVVDKQGMGAIDSSYGSPTWRHTDSSLRTYIGNWNTGASGEELGYRITAGTSTDPANNTIELGLADNVPCLSEKSGATNFVYSSKNTAGLCQNPAMAVDRINITSDQARPAGSTWGPTIILTDGTEVTLASTSNTQTTWVVPAAYRQQVARIEWRRADGDGIRIFNNGNSYAAYYGYARSGVGLKPGDALRNTTATVDAYRPSTPSAFRNLTTGAVDIALVGSATQSIGKTLGTLTNPFNATVTPGASATWRIGAAVSSPTDLVGPYVTISDLWPGNLPIPASVTSTPTNFCTGGYGVCSVVEWSGIPRVIPNFDGTYTLLQWKIPVSVFNAVMDASTDRSARLYAALPATSNAVTGVYKNYVRIQEAYEDNPSGDMMNGNLVQNSDTGPGQDLLNLDGDARTTATVGSNSTLTVSGTTGGQTVTKEVKGDLDGDFQLNPARGAMSAAGGFASYRLTWKNTGPASLNGSVLYDILPYDGDHGTLAANESQSRGSNISVSLKWLQDPLPAGVRVWYATTDDPCRPEVYQAGAMPTVAAMATEVTTCLAADWTEVTNVAAFNASATPATVKALRWANSATFTTNQSWSVQFHVTVPTLSPTDIAWNREAGNSVNIGANAMLSPVDAPKVGLQQGRTGDLTWTKATEGGVLLSGATFEVVAVDAAKVPTGAVRTVTDCTADPCTGADLDPAAGKFRIDGATLTSGTEYRITETEQPSGFVLDQTPRYLTSGDYLTADLGQVTNYLPPTGSGTAAVTYDRDWDWTIAKAVSPNGDLTATRNTVVPLVYTVTATPTAQDTFQAGAGTLRITNPNGVAITEADLALSASSAGASCTTATDLVDVTIPAYGDYVVPVTCTYTTADPNTITLSMTDGLITGTQTRITASATATTRFNLGLETDKSVRLTDVLNGVTNPNWAGATVIAATSGTASTFTYHGEITSPATVGEKATQQNTVTLSSDDGADKTAEQIVTVNSVANLSTTAAVAANFDRDYLWEINKLVEGGSVARATAPVGGSADFDYSVEVKQDGWRDFGWSSDLSWSVYNPNSIPVPLAGLYLSQASTDLQPWGGDGASCAATSGAAVASVAGDRLNLVPLTVPASTRVTGRVHCTYTAQPAGDHLAFSVHADWDSAFGSPASSVTGVEANSTASTWSDLRYLGSEKDKTVTLTDDQTDPFGTPQQLGTYTHDGAAAAKTVDTVTYALNIAAVRASWPAVNTARLIGDEPSVPVDVDQALAFVDTPAIKLVKTANRAKFVVGDKVRYTFQATNTGNVTLSQVTLDDRFDVGTGAPVTIGGCLVDGAAVTLPATLAPGKMLTCTASYLATQADVDRASLHNRATVTGTPPQGPDVTDTDDLTITSTPAQAIKLVKSADLTEFGVGDKVTYTFKATNTGNVTLTRVKISELAFDGGKLPAISGCKLAGAAVTMPVTLAPGQVLTCTATYVANRADVVRGKLANLARVDGTPPSGRGIAASSEVTTPAHREVKLSLVKKIYRFVDVNQDEVVDAGDKVIWSFKVTNKSKKSLSKLAIADQLLADAGVEVTCPNQRLAAGASAICISDWYVVTEQDVAQGRVYNIATASAEVSKQEVVLSNSDSTLTPTNLTGVLPAEDESGDDPGNGDDSGKDLAFTGFAGGSIAVVGGVLALLGAVVLVLVRRRRTGQEG